MTNTYKLIFDIVTSNVSGTEKAGADIANVLLDRGSDMPLFIAMYGDLGTGKTAFTRGIASVISPEASVHSPTFSLVNQYKSKYIDFYHFDMYRITGDDDLYSIGFYDYLSECEAGRALCVVEWSENIEFALPEKYIEITISKTDDGEDQRRIAARLAERRHGEKEV